jgi:hypothetical protein
MTAAVFEAEFVPCAENEVSKTKLHFNLSPAAGINLVLAPVRVHRYLILDSDKSPPIVFLDASGSTFTKRGRVGQSVSVKMSKIFFKVDFSNFPSPNRKKFALRAILMSMVGGLISRVSRAGLNFVKKSVVNCLEVRNSPACPRAPNF